MSSKYDAETRARAVRLVRDHVGDYESEFAAIRAVAGRLGMSTEALRRWVRQAEVDGGEARRTCDPAGRRQPPTGGDPLPGSTIHHSDAGSQYTSVHFGETLELEGIRPSIGTVGDAYDIALAETTIGLYKTECTRAGSPFRAGPFARLSDIEDATSAWVHWYNGQAHAPARPAPTGRTRS